MIRLLQTIWRIGYGGHEWEPFVPIPFLTYRDISGNVLLGGVLMRRRRPDMRWEYRKATVEEKSLYIADSVV